MPAAHTFKIGDEFNFSAWGGTAPYRFSSASPDLATIDESGHLVAKALGDVVVEVTDSLGNKASSVSIKISDGSGGGGGDSGDCPLDNHSFVLFCASSTHSYHGAKMVVGCQTFLSYQSFHSFC